MDPRRKRTFALRGGERSPRGLYKSSPTAEGEALLSNRGMQEKRKGRRSKVNTIPLLIPREKSFKMTEGKEDVKRGRG